MDTLYVWSKYYYETFLSPDKGVAKNLIVIKKRRINLVDIQYTYYNTECQRLQLIMQNSIKSNNTLFQFLYTINIAQQSSITFLIILLLNNPFQKPFYNIYVHIYVLLHLLEFHFIQLLKVPVQQVQEMKPLTKSQQLFSNLQLIESFSSLGFHHLMFTRLVSGVVGVIALFILHDALNNLSEVRHS